MINEDQQYYNKQTNQYIIMHWYTVSDTAQ